MPRQGGDAGLHSLSTCGNEATARCRELVPRCASCGNAGSVQAVALRLKINPYFGLAPSQRSSGDSVRLGGISGAGNALVRKLAVEGSWCYAAARHQPKLMPRDTGVPLEIRMHGRKGSERLLRRREEMLARGVPAAKANAATAAELVRWLWALGMMCREGAE